MVDRLIADAQNHSELEAQLESVQEIVQFQVVPLFSDINSGILDGQGDIEVYADSPDELDIIATNNGYHAKLGTSASVHLTWHTRNNPVRIILDVDSAGRVDLRGASASEPSDPALRVSSIFAEEERRWLIEAERIMRQLIANADVYCVDPSEYAS